MMRRSTTDDYAVDAATAAKALVGARLFRRLEDGSVMRRRIGIAYASQRDHKRKWRFTLKRNDDGVSEVGMV